MKTITKAPGYVKLQIFVVRYVNLILISWCTRCFLLRGNIGIGFCGNERGALSGASLLLCSSHRVGWCLLLFRLSRRLLGRHLRGQVRRFGVELCLHAPLDAQHLAERVFRARLDFEAVPFGPEGGVDPWVAELRGVRVDRTRAVDFAQFALHGCESQTHLGGLAVGQDFQSAFVYRASSGETVVFCRFRDVDSE